MTEILELSDWKFKNDKYANGFNRKKVVNIQKQRGNIREMEGLRKNERKQ